MATANLPPGASPVEHHNGADPFLAPHDAHRQRYSAFDNSNFSLYLNGSPTQAKRALHAHLAETTRRLQETSHLGNALVQQRKELEDKLHEVEQQHQDNDIGPELRQRLAELEKEFNEVGRETARAFLPKSRVPSGETMDSTGGASIYSSEAHMSPTKVSVPSRKQRNQQPSRIGDIALATEISTSLLSQLKELQAVLLEKDDALKAADLDRSQLEIEVEGLSQRLRTLDESESRLKDVNWNLETQVRESETQAKSAADKEHRLNHALNQARTDTSTLQRELEELKQTHSKLSDDHINKTKQHETELSSLRRTAAMTETEKGAMQRKVEELTSKNQEFAKAMAYRARSEERGRAEDTSPEDGGKEGDSRTPEHSPPPSPNKATPRHGMLESETLKHSLQHAHRMIQQLKNNIHREKTEKIELKRMLQDARDELETTRTTALPGSASKRRKSDKDAFKKPARPDRLGSLRTGTMEILEVDDDEWEEQEGEPSPSKRLGPTISVPGSFPGGFSSAAETSTYEGFETANETSDAAFETANERDAMATESDAFQTGAETLDGDSSDQLTETEAVRPRSSDRRSRPSFAKGRLDSYESTASASENEFGDREFRTPLQKQPSRFRLKDRDSGSRRSTPRGGHDLFAGTPASRDSPASYVSSSNESTPAQGKSLFAELNDLSGDEDDGSSVDGSPSRASVLFSPNQAAASGQASAVPKPVMVDSGMMTEPVVPPPVNMSSISSQNTQPQAPRVPTLQLSSFSSQRTSPRAAPRADLKLSSLSSQVTEPKRLLVPALNFSGVSGQATSPESPEALRMTLSSVSAQGTAPQAPPAPQFGYSALHAQDTAPRTVPIAPLNISLVSAHATEPRHVALPSLVLSALSSQGTEPRHVAPPSLGISAFSSQGTEPRHVAPHSLGVSAFSSQGTEPVAPVIERIMPPSLDVSSISHQTTEPREAAASSLPVAAGLFTSAISTQSTEPIAQTESSFTTRGLGVISDETVPEHTEQASRETKQPVPLQMSSLSAHSTKPRDVPHKPILLQMSSVSAHSTEPRDVPHKPIPLQMSSVSAHTTEPRDVARPALSMHSATSTQATQPLAPKRERQQLSQLSSHATAPMAPRPSRLQLSGFSSHSTEPVGMPKPAPSQLSSLVFQASHPQESLRPSLSTFSTVSSQSTEPVVPLKATIPSLSMLSSQVTEPIQPRQQVLPQLSAISTQQTEPVTPVTSVKHHFSDVHTVQDTQPESPTLPAFLPTPTSRPSTANRIPAPILSLSCVTTQGTDPLESPRPATAHRIFPPQMVSTNSQTEAVEHKQPFLPKLGYFDTVLPWDKGTPTESVTPPTGGKDSRMPLTPINTNAAMKTPRTPTADGGTQTMVSAEQIDKLLLARNQRWSGIITTVGNEKSLSPPESPSRRLSAEPGRTPRRPGSSGSMRSRAATPPPLPPDHKEVIAAASLKPITPVTPGTMGPPTIPASAYKKRPYTPTVRTSSNGLTPKTGGTTPRARRQSQRSGASSPLSRMSSLSSFTSEIDQRFNIPGGPNFAPHGVPAGTTDPRMIQAITQTMIGEYLWKYTRKTGREAMSETRHRRFFWIHPYTRTLYWSDRDPQSADKSQLKSKSVAIESVEIVEDPNPLPPGLHQKSLLVHTPGRAMKFTATTGQRHDTWYNALNYLCQRVEDVEQQSPPPPQPQREQDEQSEAADEIADEFNGGFRASSRQTGRSRASMSSYATRTSSRDHAEVPTLRQSTVKQQRALSTEPPVHGSVSSRFSTLLRPSASAMRGSFSSFRNKAGAQESTTFEEPSSSTMELSRNIHEHVESDQDVMPNVRACCDGKHDVAHLHTHHTVKARNLNPSSSRPNLFGSNSSRAQSRTESRTESRTGSRTESRNEQIRHQTDMEAANFGAGA